MAQRTARIGVLTGGGDAPGLNAVIRAVVKAGCNAGLEVIGLEDSFDGLLDSSRSPPPDAPGRHRHPPARRHHPRHDQPRQPVRVPDRRSRREGRLFRPGGRDLRQDGARRPGRDRRRRHPGDRAPVLPQGHSGRRGAQDHRQRHRRHDQLLRLRHRGVVRVRRHRPAAHHRRGASPHHGRGGDGALRRVDRPPCRHRRRRRRHPDSRRSPTTSRRSRQQIRERDAWGARFSIVVVAEGAKPTAASSRCDRRRDPGWSNGSAASARRWPTPCRR